MCKELKKRRVDVYCIQEVRWRGQGARFMGTSGRRYKLCWLGNDAGSGEVGSLMKEEIFGNVVEVRRKKRQSNGGCANLSRKVMRIICAHGHKAEDQTQRKFFFMMNWRVSGTLEVLVKSSSVGNFNGHVEKCAEGFDGVHEGNGIGKKMQKEDCWSFVMKESCAGQTLSFISHTRRKSLIVPVDVKQKLILCLWEKIQKVHKRCESDFIGTSAQAGGCKSGYKSCENAT